MDAGDYKPELLTGFSHHLLHTHSLLEIFHTLDLGKDFPFTDFLRAVLFPDADFKPVQDQAPVIWMSLKMNYYDDFKDYVKVNNIILKTIEPIRVNKKPIKDSPENEAVEKSSWLLPSWWPSFNWFSSDSSTSNSDAMPLLDDKKHI